MIYYVCLADKPLKVGFFFNEDSTEDLLRSVGCSIGEPMSILCFYLSEDFKFKNRESSYENLVFLRAFSAEELKPYHRRFSSD